MNIKLHKSTAFVFFFFAFSGNLHLLLQSYTAVFIHETAHLAMCAMCKEKAEEIGFGIWGMNLKIRNTVNTKRPYAIWASGPIVSFFVFAVFFLFGKFNFFMYANLCIGIINLVPALPLDGGMLLKTFLSSKLGIIRAGKIMSRVSVLLCRAGILLMVLCILLGVFNISFFIFVPMLLFSQKSSRALLLQDKKAVLSGNVGSRNKFRYIAIDSSKELLAVAELISPSSRLFVAVFEDGKFIGALTQEDIISAIMKKGALEKIGECISFSMIKNN